MAKPTLALIPASQGSKVFSVLPSSGVGDFDFSRGSAATRINSQGLIENVASGQSRLEYPLIDGVVSGCPSLLLEPSRTNLLQYSEDFTSTEWTKNSVSTPIADSISPDGSLNGYSVTNNATGTCILYDNEIGASLSDSTFSVFFKYKDLQYVSLRIDSPTDTALFDILNGSIVDSDATITPRIENYGNGWYRCSITHDSLTAAGNAVIMWNESGVLNNNTMASTSVGYYVYGAQYEVGSYPSSYIPTNGTTVTRSAETATGAGDATTFNDSEGVLMAEISALANDGTNRLISIANLSGNENTIWIGLNNGSGTPYFYLISNGVAQSTHISSIDAKNTNVKLAVKYKANDVSFYVNGFELYKDTSATMPIGLTQLRFSRKGGSLPFYGNTKQVQYYNSALTDSELEELTSWDSFVVMAIAQLYTIE